MENTQCTPEKSGLFQASWATQWQNRSKNKTVVCSIYLYSENEFFKVNAIDQWIQINHYWPSVYNLLSSRNAKINNNSQKANYNSSRGIKMTQPLKDTCHLTQPPEFSSCSSDSVCVCVGRPLRVSATSTAHVNIHINVCQSFNVENMHFIITQITLKPMKTFPDVCTWEVSLLK